MSEEAAEATEAAKAEEAKAEAAKAEEEKQKLKEENELLKKKNEYFSGSVEIPSYQGIISLLNNQGEKLDNVDYLLDLVENVIRSKYSDSQNLRYKAIPINNSCVLT